MILVVSNAADVTADFFVEQLARAHCEFRRLDTEAMADLPLTFAINDQQWSGHLSVAASAQVADSGPLTRVDLRGIHAVYYRRPQPPVLPPETPAASRAWMESEIRRAWGGVLYALTDVRWVNQPLAVSGASYKPEQLARAVRFGLDVPSTVLTSDPNAALAFCEGHDWDVIAKPVGHGEVLAETPAEDRLVYTNLVKPEMAEKFTQIADCPTLLQCRIPKDVDLRITVVGAECLAVALHSQEREVSAVDCRRDNMAGMRYSRVDLPETLATTLIHLTHSYGLHYAAIDLVRTPDGRYWFLELNPAGQWAWLEQETGIAISAALIRCLGARSMPSRC